MKQNHVSESLKLKLYLFNGIHFLKNAFKHEEKKWYLSIDTFVFFLQAVPSLVYFFA